MYSRIPAVNPKGPVVSTYFPFPLTLVAAVCVCFCFFFVSHMGHCVFACVACIYRGALMLLVGKYSTTRVTLQIDAAA